MIFTEIFVEDCTYFNTMTSADPTHWTIPSSLNVSYSSNGMKFQPNSFVDSYLEIPLTKPYSVEFDLIQYSGNPTYLHYLWDSTKTTRQIFMGLSSGKTILDTYPSSSNYWNASIPQGSHVRIEVNEDNVKLYANDDLKLTKSYTMPSSSILGLAGSSNTTCTWKNIKIKPL